MTPMGRKKTLFPRASSWGSIAGSLCQVSRSKARPDTAFLSGSSYRQEPRDLCETERRELRAGKSVKTDPPFPNCTGRPIHWGRITSGNSARLRHLLSGVQASATFAGLRPFQPSSASRTFSMAVSFVNGGNGWRGPSAVMSKSPYSATRPTAVAGIASKLGSASKRPIQARTFG